MKSQKIYREIRLKFLAPVLCFFAIGYAFSLSAEENYLSPQLQLQLNKKFSKFAIGIASPGPGASAMGHLFLYFSPKNNLLSESVIYEFNLKREENLQRSSNNKWTEFKKFFGYGEIFSVELKLAKEKTRQYLGENRSVFLYYFALEEEEIYELMNKLNEEFFWRNNSPQKDYSFINNNCLVMALQFLNEILEKKQAQTIDYLDSKSFTDNLLSFFSAMSLKINNAPFLLAPKLEEHKLFMYKEILQPKFIQQAQSISAVLQSGYEIDKQCHYNGMLYKYFENIVFQEELLNLKSSYNILEELKTCTAAHDYLKALLSEYYNLVSDPEQKSRIEDLEESLL